MASDPITSWQINGETRETVTDFIFLASKITADGDCSHEIKRCLIPERKAMTNLDSVLKSRDITLLKWRWSEEKVTQLCPTLWDMDYIVHGILQARILEWVAFLFFRGSSQPRDRTQVSCIAGRFFTSWATREALANKGPSSQSYGFSSSHVWMWELDHKKGWVLKN